MFEWWTGADSDRLTAEFLPDNSENASAAGAGSATRSPRGIVGPPAAEEIPTESPAITIKTNTTQGPSGVGRCRIEERTGVLRTRGVFTALAAGPIAAGEEDACPTRSPGIGTKRGRYGESGP